MLSPRLLSIICLALAIALPLVLDGATSIERALGVQVFPAAWSSNSGANRPMRTCVPSSPGDLNSATQSTSTEDSDAAQNSGNHNCRINFSLSLSQGSVVQVQGSSSTVNAKVTLVSGTSVSVTMSARGVPAATKILFAPSSGKPSFSTSLTITTRPGTPLGQFNMTVVATGGGHEESARLSLQIVPIVHDIAVSAASVQGTATVGSIVSINATVANYGSVSEVFELRAYANDTLVANQSMIKLAPEANYTGHLMWNTTGYSPGTYRVRVAVPPVQGQLNTLDNSRGAGQLILTKTSGSGPNPSPAASGGSSRGFTYGRQLAVAIAIAEAAVVFLIFLRGQGKGPTRTASGGNRKI